MKVLVAITCLAFVANVFGEDPVPQSIGGSLLRSKSHLVGRFADGYDRIIQRIRGLSPLGLLRLDSNRTTVVPPSSSVTVTIGSTTAAPAGPIPSTVAPATTLASLITTTSSDVGCAVAKKLKAKLAEETAAKTASHELIHTATTGLLAVQLAAKDAEAKTSSPATIAALNDAEGKLKTEVQNEAHHDAMITQIQKLLLEYITCP